MLIKVHKTNFFRLFYFLITFFFLNINASYGLLCFGDSCIKLSEIQAEIVSSIKKDSGSEFSEKMKKLSDSMIDEITKSKGDLSAPSLAYYYTQILNEQYPHNIFHKKVKPLQYDPLWILINHSNIKDRSLKLKELMIYGYFWDSFFLSSVKEDASPLPSSSFRIMFDFFKKSMTDDFDELFEAFFLTGHKDFKFFLIDKYFYRLLKDQQKKWFKKSQVAIFDNLIDSEGLSKTKKGINLFSTYLSRNKDIIFIKLSNLMTGVNLTFYSKILSNIATKLGSIEKDFLILCYQYRIHVEEAQAGDPLNIIISRNLQQLDPFAKSSIESFPFHKEDELSHPLILKYLRFGRIRNKVLNAYRDALINHLSKKKFSPFETEPNIMYSISLMNKKNQLKKNYGYEGLFLKVSREKKINLFDASMKYYRYTMVIFAIFSLKDNILKSENIFHRLQNLWNDKKNEKQNEIDKKLKKLKRKEKRKKHKETKKEIQEIEKLDIDFDKKMTKGKDGLDSSTTENRNNKSSGELEELITEDNSSKEDLPPSFEKEISQSDNKLCHENKLELVRILLDTKKWLNKDKLLDQILLPNPETGMNFPQYLEKEELYDVLMEVNLFLNKSLRSDSVVKIPTSIREEILRECKL